MIFISHSAKDEACLREFVAALRARGAEVWFAPDDIPLGASIPEEMALALARAARVLVTWSRHSAASQHVKDEYRSFYKRHPEPGPLLFMRLDETELDPLFRDRLYYRATGDAAHDAAVIADWAAGARNREIVSERLATEEPRDGARHPLHDYPRGPMVELHRVPDTVVRAYTLLLRTWPVAHALVHEANRLRIAADRDATCLGLEYLPSFDAGAYAFWLSAFYEACRHGPRMLAALLYAQPFEQFTDEARRDRAQLLEHLRGMTPGGT